MHPISGSSPDGVHMGGGGGSWVVTCLYINVTELLSPLLSPAERETTAAERSVACVNCGHDVHFAA